MKGKICIDPYCIMKSHKKKKAEIKMNHWYTTQPSSNSVFVNPTLGAVLHPNHPFGTCMRRDSITLRLGTVLCPMCARMLWPPTLVLFSPRQQVLTLCWDLSEMPTQSPKLPLYELLQGETQRVLRPPPKSWLLL